MATMTALSTVTVGAGGAATIDFTSIPQTYTDLVVKISQRADGTNSYPNMRFNNSASSYSIRYLYGSGSASSTGTGNTTYFELLGAEGPTQTANTFTNQEIYIPNYTSSNFKSISVDTVSENNDIYAEAALIAGLWSNSAAITSVLLRPTGATNFVQYTTATLYGVWKGPEVLPSTPTIGTATAVGGTGATVAFTPTSATNVDASYTALSSPGSITATGTSSPVTVTGLTENTAYTFQVRANNPGGSSAYSAASNSVTPSTLSFESIATSTVGSGGSSSITFSSIPTNYTHLQIRIMGRIDQVNTDDNIYFRFNGDSATNYAGHYFFGTGANPAVGAAATGQTQGVACRTTGGSSGANMFGIGVCDILDYRNTNKNKTVRVLTGHDQNGSGLTFLMSTLWQSTSAITSITLFTLAGNMTQYTKLALYGIKGA